MLAPREAIPTSKKKKKNLPIKQETQVRPLDGIPWKKERKGALLQCTCLANSMDIAWSATGHGIAESNTAE